MRRSSPHKVQDKDWKYTTLKQLVDFSLFQAYREIVYLGLEKIPTDGAIIFAPNHTNALMDALLVLALDQRPKVFVARADIFRSRKVAKILDFLKMMPIMRIRDGIDEVKKNDEIIRRSADVLMDNVPFCILPEGTHNPKHSLLPLSKGIFRIAIQAQEKIADKMSLYIIPLGIDYGNFFRFRSTALIQVGEPMNVRDYMSAHSDLTQPELMNIMKEDLAERMKDIILYIPDNNDYDSIYEICANLINDQITLYRHDHPDASRRSLKTRKDCNKKTVSELTALMDSDPEKARELLDMARDIRAKRLDLHISLGSVTTRHPLWAGLLKTLIFLVTLPYTIPASIAALPVTGVSRLIVKMMKMKDPSFLNSIRFVITFIFWPILIIIYAIILFCCLPWPIALLITAALIPACLVANDDFRLLRLIISDFRLRFSHTLRRDIATLRTTYRNYCG